MKQFTSMNNYVGDQGNVTSKHRVLSKKVSFSQLETNLMKKRSSIFQLLTGVGVIVQSFMLGPCASTKL